MRSVFFGTPAIAVPALRALAETTEVVGVVCQPDRPAGRGMKLSACAVKQAALELGLDVHQPLKVKTGRLHEWLSARRCEIALVLAYGRILPRAVLDAPHWGCVNLHASLLPRYRGAAPINWAIAHGETLTGMSLMKMDEGLDTGPVYSQRTTPISVDMTAGELAVTLSELGAEMVRGDLQAVWTGAVPTPQDGTQATYAPPITPGDLVVNWEKGAREVHDQVRAFAPRPGAHTYLGKKRIKLLQTGVADPRYSSAVAASAAAPGQVLSSSGQHILVATGSGTLFLERAQPEGKRELSARDLINGRVIVEGARFTNAPQ